MLFEGYLSANFTLSILEYFILFFQWSICFLGYCAKIICTSKDAFAIMVIQYNLKDFTLYIPVYIYLLKVNNKNFRTSCEICSKLTLFHTLF